jgi:hypothetical protein
MGKPAGNHASKSLPMPSSPSDKSGKFIAKPVTAADYFSLASFLQRREQLQRGVKREPQSDAIRAAGEQYEHREYAAAYDTFKPVYDRIVADMQRVLARNIELEAKKMAAQQGKSLALAKEHVQQMRAHAQQVADQFEKLRQDLEHKPLVRLHIKKRTTTPAAAPQLEQPPPTVVNSANETRVGPEPAAQESTLVENDRYQKAPYAPPEIGSLYSVRDKSQAERVISVIAISKDGQSVQVEVQDQGSPKTQLLQLAVDSLARQAAKGWCHLLLPIADASEASEIRKVAATPIEPRRPDPDGHTLRIDIQNFGRCCATIAFAELKYNTQLIKDVADGSFRAGEYEKAFLTFEQLVIGFTSAVNSSRQQIADARRELIAEKGNLSGREVMDRTAALVRREQRVFAAEREFNTILEGLRMYVMVKH